MRESYARGTLLIDQVRYAGHTQAIDTLVMYFERMKID